MINNIHDFISISVLFFNYDYLIKCLHGDFSYYFMLVFLLYFEHQLKIYFKTWNMQIFMRPDNAYNCGLLNDGGYVGDQCGFPSGHSLTTSFYFYVYYFQNQKNMGSYKKLWLSMIQIPILLVMNSRLNKHCHNEIQVFGGYVLGLFFAFLFY